MYIELVINDGRPRSWEFEGVFLDIRAALPDVPGPTSESSQFPSGRRHSINGYTVPKTTKPLTVDEAGARLALAASYKTTCIDLCKTIIRGSARAPPTGPNPIPDSEFTEECCELLRESYEAGGVGEYAEQAIRLLLPHLVNPEFQTALKMIGNEQVWMPADDHVALLDLLLEAHELSIPEPMNTGTVLAPHTTLLDLITRRNEYLPITKEGSFFFFFGARLDYGPSLQSYREVAELMLQGTKRPKIELEVVLLELVQCAVEHLGGNHQEMDT